MLIKLMPNAVDLASREKVTVQTIAAILSGTITDKSQLDSTYFFKDQSSFSVGSYPPAYWTVETDSTSADVNGYVVLSQASAVSGKTNYMKIYYDVNYIQVSIGTANSAGTLANTGTVSNGAYVTGLTLYPLFISFGSKFVHIYHPIKNLSSVYQMMVVEMTDNAYDQYSAEGTLKQLNYAWGADTSALSLKISNMFNPKLQTYTANLTTLANCYNVANARLVDIGQSKGPDVTDNYQMLVPIIFNDYTKGWMGGNISAITGLYIASVLPSYGTEFVTVGADTYHVISAYSDAAGQAHSVFLAKV